MKLKDIILFNTSDQKVRVSVYFQKGTFWLTQKAMAELFDVNVPAISKHLKNIFETKELAEDSVISVLETTASDGKNYSTTWKDAPEGKIQKSDVSIAKNYLSHQHISELNRIVSAYLDLAENNAQRGIAFNMQQWRKFLDGFLELSSYPILRDKGKISMLEAKLKAETEFDKFRVIQDKTYESDFDRMVKELGNKGNVD